jgi:hypothetical protein
MKYFCGKLDAFGGTLGLFAEKKNKNKQKNVMRELTNN